MAPAPYVGVTGFMHADEVRAALDAFPACGRQIMIGALASSKSLAGEPTRWARRYPNPSAIGGIFSKDPRALNLVHYATGGEEDEHRLLGALTAALGYGGPLCHGIQVNAVWPAPIALELLHARKPAARIVLQVGPGAMAADFFGENMVATLGAYDGAITDVLIDASGGLGLPLDAGLARRVAAACRAALPGVCVGIAGGLDAVMVGSFASLIREGYSCDAEGRLRDDADGGGNLVFDKVRTYLASVGSLLQPGGA